MTLAIKVTLSLQRDVQFVITQFGLLNSLFLENSVLRIPILNSVHLNENELQSCFEELLVCGGKKLSTLNPSIYSVIVWSRGFEGYGGFGVFQWLRVVYVLKFSPISTIFFMS